MVIIPEICITQVSGIICAFAADMRKIVLSIIMLGWLSSALRNIARERYFHKADCLPRLHLTHQTSSSNTLPTTSRKHVATIPAHSTRTWDGTSPRLSCASTKTCGLQPTRYALPYLSSTARRLTADTSARRLIRKSQVASMPTTRVC